MNTLRFVPWFGAALTLGGVSFGAELPDRLKALDRDGDGKLSAVEFIDRDLFAKVDYNRDGFVTADEVRRFYLANPPAKNASKQPAAGKQPQRTPEEVFGFLDRDADGSLSRREFEPLQDAIPYFRANPAVVEGTFKQLDANSDGGLSLAEFRGLYALGGQPVPPPAKNDAAMAPPPPPPAPIGPLKPEDVAFFEKHIRPVLADKCYPCHSASAEKVKGGLVVDTREGLREGGDGGPAIVPGDLARSLLFEAITYKNADLQMPPEKEGGKLPDAVISNFEKWIKMGAPDPREGAAKLAVKAVNIEKGREFWAFQPPKEVPVPAVKDTAWPRSDIDRHLLAAMEAKNVRPVGDAGPRDLIRRLSFDLIGLPPTPEEVDAFAADSIRNPQSAIRNLADRLLASPRFGERWARHWLDVARYADSSGRGSNLLYPEAWRYRDYVIASFNADKPYDEFLREQIAGDLLPAKDEAQRAERLVATGFLALGPKELAERDRLQFQLDVVDEQLDTLGQAMLGLTIGCARCHDHKFDPIPQRDYYSLAGIFRSTETCYGTVAVVTNTHPSDTIELPSVAPRAVVPPTSAEKLRADQARLDRELRAMTGGRGLESYVLPTDPEKLRPFIATRSQLVIVNAKLKEFDADGKPRPFAMGVREKSNPADMPLYSRGEPAKPAAPVPRGFLQVMPNPGAPIAQGSGRRELAEWIASPENPLTARVMVNRVWHHLFGRGLVASVDNFGAQGDRPSNPALLDHLALKFIAGGWSVKSLLRETVLSRAYQLATTHDAANVAIDPDNVLGWRMSARRLDAEAARDAMLAVSGRLDLSPMRGSVAARIGNNFVNPALPWAQAEATSGMRSVYLTVLRDQVNEAIAVFDFANANAVTGNREETITPAQTLFLMNSPVMQSFANAWATRLSAAPESERVRMAYRQAFGREPTATETHAAKALFERLAKTGVEADAARVAFCQAIFASAEFRMLN